MLETIKQNINIRKQIKLIKTSLEVEGVVLPSDLTKFVFLCGANKTPTEISERRRALIEFSQKNLPNTQFFLAEKVFNFLQSEGHNGNVLDVENEISKFADFIIIVLESYSSFAELGAFSHKELRDKLVIINDKRYLHTPSFINLGPIKAVKESVGEHRIISYKMKENGLTTLDAIGTIYGELHKILQTTKPKKQKALSLSDCDPSLVFDKFSLMFIHDLIYFAGPVKYIEVLELCFQLFGKKSFNKLKEHIGMLAAINAVNRGNNGLIRSNRGKLYLHYPFDENRTISLFRNITQKKFGNRFYEN